MLYLGILFLLAILLFVPINTTLGLHMNEKSLEYDLKIYMFKFIRVYSKAGVIPDYLKQLRHSGKKEDKLPEKTAKKSNVKVKLRSIVNTYCENRDKFTKLRLYMKRKFKLKDFIITIDQGTGDAAYTGLLYGVIWNILSMINSVLSFFFTLTYKNITVNSNYNNRIFKAEISCIFKLTIANIIIVLLRLYYIMKKYKQNNNKLSGGGKNE